MGDDGADYSNVAAGGQVNVTHPLHVEQHEDGGEDELNVGGLSGELADAQPTKTHKATHEDEGDDEINLEGLSGTPAELFIVAAIYNTDAGQSIPNSEPTIVNFDTKVQDTHNAVTTGTAWKFTAPVAGFYQVTGVVLFTGTTTWSEGERGLLSFNVNDVVVIYVGRTHSYGTSLNMYMQIAGSVVIYLNEGDDFSLTVNQSSGAALALLNQVAYNRITIVKVVGN